MRQTLCAFILVMLLTACSSTTDVSSGEDYLARHNLAATTDSNTKDAENKKQTFADLLRDAASVEPTLQFPARIGLARIKNGELSDIPPAEAAAWGRFAETDGKTFGEFTPVNPMIASMFQDAANNVTPNYYPYRSSSEATINKIRLTAARQHLDAVLIYEVHSKHSKDDNLLAVGKITVIGGFILPSKSIETEGYATAILIDVMQAYPYGTVQAYADKDTSYASAWGWGDTYDSDLVGKIEAIAVERLTVETGTMLEKLRTQLAEVQAKKQVKKISSKKK